MDCSSTNTAVATPVGTRFDPNDEELTHFLTEKMLGNDSRFPEIDCCKHQPWDLIVRFVPTKDKEWWFFSPRVFKYPNSKRSQRATEEGYWKCTGKPRKIKVGLFTVTKRILTFYIGRAPNSTKTNYIMHEYELENGDSVLCRLKINPDKSHKKKGTSISEEADPDSYISSMFENQPAADDMIAEQDKQLEDPLLPSGNVGECKESQKDSSLIDVNDMIAGNESQSQFGEDHFSLSEFVFIDGQCYYSCEEETQFPSIDSNQPAADDMITEQEEILAFQELQDNLFLNDNVGEHAFSDFEKQEAFAQMESVLHPTQPEEQHLGNVPLADVNNGESSRGKSPSEDEPVSNAASNFGSATDDSIREVFTQPGEDLEPLDFSFLQDNPLLSPMHTEPRDVLPGNNCIAGNELQSQCGDCDFPLTDYYPYLQTTPSPSIDSNLPKSLGTQSTFNCSFQGNYALATGGSLQCS